MNYNSAVEPKHLGGGVVLFERVFEIDWDWAFTFAQNSIEHERQMMYTPAIHPETGENCYINNSGYYFSKESIEEMPYRASLIHQNPDLQVVKTLSFIDQVKYHCLIKYCELFPVAFKSIWWHSRGHITEYRNGAHMGPHADIQTDYIYGLPHPKGQLAMKNVVATIAYFNDSVDSEKELDGKNFLGGTHRFTYLDINYNPKKGDIIMFPSDYFAAHEIKPTISGSRYAYLGWYCHGTPNKELGEHVADPLQDPTAVTREVNVYMPFFREDYFNYIKSKGYNKDTYQYIVADKLESYSFEYKIDV